MGKHTRLYQLFEYLIREDHNYVIDELAEQFGVSSRTIRYDLDEIEEFISNFELKMLRKPNWGVSIRGTPEEKVRAYRIFERFYLSRHFLPTNKRQYLLLYWLFQQKEPVLITELADFLEVSYSTARNDLDQVEEWLKHYDLQLVRKRNYGVKIEGEEIDIRHGMAALISETSKNGEMISILNRINERENASSRLEKGYHMQLKRMLGEVSLEPIERAVRFAEKDLSFKFTDDAFTGLIFHIAFAISRLLAGQDITIEKERLALLKEQKEFSTAQAMAGMLEVGFGVRIPEDELGFITLHLVGAKLRENHNYRVVTDDPLTTLTSAMIRVVENYLKVDLSDDADLFEGLLLHLKATINRFLFDLPIKNPLLDEIKNHYYDIFRAAGLAAKILQSEVNREITEDAVGYIALHFGAALERRNYLQKNARVVVVCASGLGTANLLIGRLENEFKELEITGNMSVTELVNEDRLLEKTDFIISTVPLDLPGYDVIEVNPFLPENDISKIRGHLKKYYRQGDAGERNVRSFSLNQAQKAVTFDPDEIFDKLVPFLKEDCKAMARQLLRDHYSQEGAVSSERGMNLLDLLSPDLIEITGEDDLTWKEAIRVGGGILLEQGYIRQEYVEKMIEIVEKNGPYVVIAPHVCFTHASPKDGVVTPGISLVVFQKGVAFNHEFDPVYYLFTLAPIDNHSHMSALADIIEVLNDERLMEGLKQAEDVQEIILRVQRRLSGRE